MRGRAAQREIIHRPYRDEADHLRRIDRYTTLWAEAAFRKGRRAHLGFGEAASFFAFLRNYFLKGGILLGTVGLRVSRMNALYVQQKFREAQGSRGRLSPTLMRILHIDTATEWRGGQNQIVLTAEGQIALGHDVLVFANAKGELAARAERASVPVHQAEVGRGDLSWRTLSAIRGAVIAFGPDVIHVHEIARDSGRDLRGGTGVSSAAPDRQPARGLSPAPWLEAQVRADGSGSRGEPRRS